MSPRSAPNWWFGAPGQDAGCRRTDSRSGNSTRSSALLFLSVTKPSSAYCTRLLVVAVAVSCCLAWVADPVAAACVPPSIEVQPVAASPGDQVTVVGRDFFVGCDDTAGPGEPFPETPGPPDTNIEIVIVQNGAQQSLRVIAANESFQFSESVTIPKSAPSGGATIRAIGANGSPEASLTITETRPTDVTIGGTGSSQPMTALPETGSAGALTVLWAGAFAFIAGVGLAVMRSFAVRRQ